MTPNGGPHLELSIGRLRLKTWSKTDFSIAQTTGQHFVLMFTLNRYFYPSTPNAYIQCSC